MGCCGQTTQGRLTIRQQDLDNGLAFEIEYLGGRTVKVKGSATGEIYVFRGTERIRNIDPRDAPAILKDRHFRLKGMTSRQHPE